MRKPVVVLTKKGARVKYRWFPWLHSWRKDVVSYPNLHKMQKIDPMFWKKDPDTGQLTEMTRPEKLKRLEYIDLNGDGDGMPELLVLALVLGLGYLCYTYYSPEWLVWIRGWF